MIPTRMTDIPAPRQYQTKPDGLLTEAALKAHNNTFKSINKTSNTHHLKHLDVQQHEVVDNQPPAEVSPSANRLSDDVEKTSGVILVDSFDTEAGTTSTQYYNPATRQYTKHNQITVRDILGPYADRISLSPKKTDVIRDGAPEKHVEFNKTLLYEPAAQNATTKNIADRMDETGSVISRFSVNDYFRKYEKNTNSQRCDASINSRFSCDQKDIFGIIEEGFLTSSESDITVNKACDQSRRYDDTRSMISGTTCLTVTTSDENAFKDGLASLDANIARIQQSLKNVSL